MEKYIRNEIIKMLYRQCGYSFGDISQEFNISRQTVSNIIYPLDYKLRRRKRKYFLGNAIALSTHTKKDWEKIKMDYNNRCAICKKKKPLTKDHITPISRGGSNSIFNIQPLCRQCNSRKWCL